MNAAERGLAAAVTSVTAWTDMAIMKFEFADCEDIVNKGTDLKQFLLPK